MKQHFNCVRKRIQKAFNPAPIGGWDFSHLYKCSFHFLLVNGRTRVDTVHFTTLQVRILLQTKLI